MAQYLTKTNDKERDDDDDDDDDEFKDLWNNLLKIKRKKWET